MGRAVTIAPMPPESSALMRSFGAAAESYFGDLRFQDVYLIRKDADGNVDARIPLHDLLVGPLFASMRRGYFAQFLGDTIRSVMDPDNAHSFEIVSEPEDDFARGLDHLAKVPGLEMQTATLRREYEARVAAGTIPKRKTRTLPLGGEFGAKEIYALFLAGL